MTTDISLHRTSSHNTAFHRNYLTPLAVDRPVDNKGYGAFAIQTIEPGTVIATFGGEVHRRHTFDLCDSDRKSRSIQIDDDLFILGPPTRDPGDSINHSCDPNCGAGNAVQIVAMRTIETGEELTFDYAMTDGSDYDTFTCACNSPKCRNTISGTDWRRRSLHNRYRNYMSPYLTRRAVAAQHAKPLGKTDVEKMMSTYDTNPRLALTTALQIVLGRPHAHWTSLVGALMIESNHKVALYAHEQSACDLLLTELNELRGVPFIDSLALQD